MNLEVDDVLTGGQYDWFCEGCAALKYDYPDDPGYSECTICDNDISSPKYLKRSAYERICGTIDVINAAIREEGHFPHDD